MSQLAKRFLDLHRTGDPLLIPNIGIAPLSVECDRITVIADPADALDHIAADTVTALRAAKRRHRR